MIGIYYRCNRRAARIRQTVRVNVDHTLSIYFQNGIHDACTQKDDHSKRTTNVGRQFPREQLRWWSCIGVTFRVGALFFQLEHGCSFVLGVVRDAVVSQDDKGRVVLFAPLFNLKGTSEFLRNEPTDSSNEITLQHITESRRKLGSCGFAL